MGGIRKGFYKGVEFELNYVEVHVIPTVKDREEVLRRKVLSQQRGRAAQDTSSY